MSDPVNSVLLSPDYPSHPDILLLSERALMLSRDDGEVWTEVPATPERMTAVLAPQGMTPGSSLLIGQVGGMVSKVMLDV